MFIAIEKKFLLTKVMRKYLLTLDLKSTLPGVIKRNNIKFHNLIYYNYDLNQQSTGQL